MPTRTTMRNIVSIAQPREKRRRTRRQAVLQRAIIYLPNREPIKCIVRNRSDGGAQLIVSEPGVVVDGFDLRIGSEAPRRCRLVWREHGLMGVAFACLDASETADRADQRGARRRRTLKCGTIVFNGGHSTVACRIVDLSDTGARLRPLSPGACPPVFDLIIGGERRCICHVVRRRGSDIGVRFVGSAWPDTTARP